MPTYEIPATHGALDSVLGADGGPVDAHLLREVARDANRQLARGELLASWSFLAGSGGLEGTSGSVVHRTTGWSSRPPQWVPKKPGLARAYVDVVARVPSGVTARFALSTLRSPSDPVALLTVSAALALAGSGAFAVYGPLEVALDPDVDYEVLQAHLYLPFGFLMSTATYGGVATGTIVQPSTQAVIFKSSATAAWNTSGTTISSNRLVARLLDNQARPYFQASIAANDAHSFQLSQYGRRIPIWNQHTFELYDVSGAAVNTDGVTLACIHVYAKDRS